MIDREIIGRFLDRLDTEARARVIASPMQKCGWAFSAATYAEPRGCLVEVALGIEAEGEYPIAFPFMVAFAYDDMVTCLGQDKANQWVRERAIAGGEAPVEIAPRTPETAVSGGGTSGDLEPNTKETHK